MALKSNAFTVITRNNSHHAVQGHLRSPILVPIESPYATMVIDLKQLHNAQNGFNSRSNIFFGNLNYDEKVTVLRNFRRTPCLWETTDPLTPSAVTASPYLSDRWREHTAARQAAAGVAAVC